VGRVACLGASFREFGVEQTFAHALGQRLGDGGRAKCPSPEGTKKSWTKKSSVKGKHSTKSTRLVFDTLAICRNTK